MLPKVTGAGRFIILAYESCGSGLEGAAIP